MQKVLSSTTNDCSHCARPASLASASFDFWAAPFNSCWPRPWMPGSSRSITNFFMSVIAPLLVLTERYMPSAVATRQIAALTISGDVHDNRPFDAEHARKHSEEKR